MQVVREGTSSRRSEFIVRKIFGASKSRDGSALVAVGVNAEARREELGVDVVTCEDGAGGLAFLRALKAGGLKGVEVVISDAHPGFKNAIASVLSGASWQRCRTHFVRNLLVLAPRAAQACVVVGRAGDRALVEVIPPATPSYVGWDWNPALDGWYVHEGVFRGLEQGRVRR